MSAESRSGQCKLSLFGSDPGFCIRWPADVLLQKVREGSHRQHASDVCFPEMNNGSGPASEESIKGEGVKTGCVDTIINDVKFFYTNYENGESHR